MRTSIYYDNIDNVSEILAKFFNRYTDSHILEWCLNKNIIDINNIKNNILRPKDHNFQRFVDAVTNRNVDPTQITPTSNVQIYQKIFPDDRTTLVTFMKFILGLTYLLLDKSGNLHVEDIYPFIGITYFIYNKIEHSSLLNSNPNNKALILRDIRNLWNNYSNTRNGEWDVLIHETHYPIFNDSSRVDLTPAFNIIDLGISQTSIPLSVYIKNSLIQVLNDIINI
ncbi:hypothetical protein RhiirA4_455185 [Rhizophagus irregularis]|uniref:Uncharacterized protein n=1 Tax=Rhizophagus irregularis TaxID=588596 RepID=A0A2I1G4T5_9GLOM|nr:hypothetical protein RhiirA4_455185 [Rhizophagus irregularis]